MTRFLSNYIFNKSFQIFCLLIFIIPCKNSFGETKLQKKLDLLHSSLSKISNEEINKENLSFVLKIIKETYDAKKMGKMIINNNWKSLSSYEQKEFVEVFEKFIAVNYLRRFSKIKRVDFKTQNIKKINENFRLVNISMTLNTSEKIELGYLLHYTKNNWLIFDVLVDGSISEIATRKSDFNNIINDQGFKKFISILKEKNEI